MKHFLFLIAIVFNLQLFAQQSVPFHSLCNQACKAIENGSVDQAFVSLSEAFRMKQFKPRAADYLNMAKCYSQQNNPDLTEKYIYLALERNPTIGRTVRIHNLWFEPIIGPEKWQKIVAISHQETVVPENVKRVIAEIKTIDSLNLASYHHYQKQIDYLTPMDTLLYKVVWDSTCQEVEKRAPLLDSILLSLSDELLTNPFIENAFLNMPIIFKPIINKKSKEVLLKLIDKGFLTPDILESVFIEEYFGKDYTFNYNKYSFKNSVFNEKYGLGSDSNMVSYRLFNHWYYDESYD